MKERKITQKDSEINTFKHKRKWIAGQILTTTPYSTQDFSTFSVDLADKNETSWY